MNYKWKLLLICNIGAKTKFILGLPENGGSLGAFRVCPFDNQTLVYYICAPFNKRVITFLFNNLIELIWCSKYRMWSIKVWRNVMTCWNVRGKQTTPWTNTYTDIQVGVLVRTETVLVTLKRYKIRKLSEL